MGLFWESHGPLPAFHAAFEDALKLEPISIRDTRQEAVKRAAFVLQQTSTRLIWPRLVAAVVIAAGLLLAAIYCAKNDLTDISKSLTASFEAFSGLVVGLLSGEGIARKSS